MSGYPDFMGIRHDTLYLQRSIGSFVADAGDADGIDVRLLRPGDSVEVRTAHSVYTVRLEDPDTGRGLGRGSGKYLEEERPVRLLGSSLSGRGTLVKCGWVLVGYKLVLATPRGELLTSRVCDVSINGRSVTGDGRLH